LLLARHTNTPEIPAKRVTGIDARNVGVGVNTSLLVLWQPAHHADVDHRSRVARHDVGKIGCEYSGGGTDRQCADRGHRSTRMAEGRQANTGATDHASGEQRSDHAGFGE